ncbi:hypothetical protein AX14_008566 [Amanita brunnescens Koide BX004]|nr:hypothetical protein AX14_008566 [Amanita brunnescens Koide BX004]
MAGIPKRNVHVFNASNGNEVAGFFQHGGVTITTFVGWINEIVSIPEAWCLYPSKFNNNRAVGGPALDSNSTAEIPPGRYVIRTLPPDSAPVAVFLTTDLPRTRAYSVNYTYTPHETDFVSRVRDRDLRCCITGDLVAAEDFTGFEAAHIFPLSETDIWNDLGYKRFIEDDNVKPGFEMNSVQQGFLCSSTEHRMFDDYSIGINPDDNYRIYDFIGRDPQRTPHGNFFYRNPNVNPRYLPSPDLLHDHFRQCVLRHVKGAGENDGLLRKFDPDVDLCPGGFDLVEGSWWSGPEGKRQFEAELASRLWGTKTALDQVGSVS